MSDRTQQLQNWLQQHCQLRDFSLQPASEDASFRRYFRVQLSHGMSYIAMDAPPDKEDIRPFADIARRLEQVGVHAPRIYHEDTEQGFMLLEDLGEKLYLPYLQAQAERLYGDALAALAVMQSVADSSGLPEYDPPMLEAEMRLFDDWLLGRHLSLELDAGQQARLARTRQRLIESAREQPQVFVHRDYHSRNLLTGIANAPGVIDFQDAVRGPVTYDLVSLLRDCYIRWPAEQVDEWAWGYFSLAVQSGILRDEHEADFLRWFDLMGAQRHLKAAGIFARLNHRDGKPGYLNDIPRTLGYIVEVAGRRPELAELAELIEQQVLPRL